MSDFNRPALTIVRPQPGAPTAACYGHPSQNPTYGNSDFAYYSTLVDVTIAVGVNAIYEGILRRWYDLTIQKMQQSFRTLAAEGYLTEEEAAQRFVEARNELTRVTRKRSGALARTIAAALKPEKGFKTFEQLRVSKTPAQLLDRGGARASANAAGKNLSLGGKACILAGVTLAIVDIAAVPPDQRGRRPAGHAGGFVGGLAVGYVGGEIGAPFGPIGAGIGFISGTVIGSLGGSKAGENYYDALVNE